MGENGMTNGIVGSGNGMTNDSAGGEGNLIRTVFGVKDVVVGVCKTNGEADADT